MNAETPPPRGEERSDRDKRPGEERPRVSPQASPRTGSARPGPSNARETLPARRYAETLDFRHDGHRFTATIGFYPDGRPGEVFLMAGKSETALESMCRDLGVVASIALQHGAPIGTIARALTRLSDGRPAGPLGVLLEELTRGEDGEAGPGSKENEVTP